MDPRSHSHHAVRRRSIIDGNVALAIRQGFPTQEARHRAITQQDLDEALTFRQLTIAEGLTEAGWQPSDWSRIVHGTMPTPELTALLAAVSALPREPRFGPVLVQ